MFNYVPRFSVVDENLDYPEDDPLELVYGPFDENLQKNMDEWDSAGMMINTDPNPPF